MATPADKPAIVVVGWREWVTLPDLSIEFIKAKVDTGARTSALHAFDVVLEREHGAVTVFFSIHPNQRRADPVVECMAPLIERRDVKDSGGHVERRCVIETNIVMGDCSIYSEVTLTDRDSMGFRMLVGRAALRGMFIVDPAKSYALGTRSKLRKRRARASSLAS